MKKQLLATTLGLAVLCAMTTPTFATDLGPDTGNAADMTVEYSEDQAYTLTIPATVALTKAGGTTDIKVTNLNLEPSKKLDVALTAGVDAAGVMTLVNAGDTSTTVTTTVTDGTTAAVALNGVAASFTADGTQALNFSAPTAPSGTVKAGSYSGTLTFTSSVN